MAILVALLCGGLSLGDALPAGGHKDLYTLDTSWKPRFPSGAHTFSAVGVAHTVDALSSSTPLVFVTQRGNGSLDPVLVMNATDGALLHSWGKDAVGLDYTKTPPTWGAHGLATEECHYPCADDGEGRGLDFMRVYIDDFTNSTVTMYTGAGKKLLQLGQNGVAGNSTSPLQYDHPADSVIETGFVAPSPGPMYGPSYVYTSDGDGGRANRVVKVRIDGQADGGHVEWGSKQIYNNPHSIALHRHELVIVADRENNETRLLRASTGEDLGVWHCGMDYGKSGKPFGVRTLSYHDDKCNQDRDLVLVAIMDNPQDGLNQRIAVLDASRLTAKDGSKSKCKVLQVIEVDPNKYSGPHLLGVDRKNGDIYAALVSDAPLSTVLRYKSTGCIDSEEAIQV